MKHLIKKIRICVPVLLSLLFLTVACDDMNSIHQKYFDRGITIHTGTVEWLRAYPGLERVRLAWFINADPRITKTVIFWNNRADSVVVDVNRTHSGFIPMYHDLEGLQEGFILFEVITRDNYGHFSMPQDVTAQVFGDVHVQSLRNRGVADIRKRGDGSVVITWQSIASPDIQYTTVSYEANGAQLSVIVQNEDTQTVLTGLSYGDRIGITTTYHHQGALEPLTSRPTYLTVPDFAPVEIPSTNFSLFVLPGDNTTVNNNRPLSNIWTSTAINNPNILHTVAGQPFPNHFTFDMGMYASISSLRIWQRVDNATAAPFAGNNPRTFEVWGTDELLAEPTDAAYFGAGGPWRNDWIKLGYFEVIDPNPGAPNNDPIRVAARDAGAYFQVDPAQQQHVRYIRLVVTSVWNMAADGGLPAVSIGRLVLWGEFD